MLSSPTAMEPCGAQEAFPQAPMDSQPPSRTTTFRAGQQHCERCAGLRLQKERVFVPPEGHAIQRAPTRRVAEALPTSLLMCPPESSHSTCTQTLQTISTQTQRLCRGPNSSPLNDRASAHCMRTVTLRSLPAEVMATPIQFPLPCPLVHPVPPVRPSAPSAIRSRPLWVILSSAEGC